MRPPYLQSFDTFVQTIGRDETGCLIQPGVIHRAMTAHLFYSWEREMGCLINAPLGHGKSTQFAVLLPLYLISLNTDNRVKIISAEEGLATDRVGSIRQYIDEDDNFKRLCPHVTPSRLDPGNQVRLDSRKRMWARGKLYVKRTGRSPDATAEAKGFFSSGVGGRANYLIFDDPVDENNCSTEPKRLRMERQFDGVWLNRPDPAGRWMMISTPYHGKDLNYYVRKKPTVCTLVLRVSEDFRVFDFEVYNAPDDQHPLLPLRR